MMQRLLLLEDAVAVVADHMGAAKKGLAALKIEWHDGLKHRVLSVNLMFGIEIVGVRGRPVALQSGSNV
jgi:isoquinoline 1-oxidoreductase beta subunit